MNGNAHRDFLIIRIANINSFLFCLAYTLIFIREVLLERSNVDDFLGTGMVSRLSTVCHLLFWFVCIVIILFFQKYTMREVLILGSLFFIFLISAVSSSSFFLLDLVFLLACSKNLNFHSFIKNAIVIQSIIILVPVLLSLGGVIEDGTLVRTSSGVVRSSCGFSHPNTLGILAFQWICEFIYLKRGMLKYAIVVIAVFAVYKITDSNTSILMTLIVIGVNFIYEVIANHLLTRKQLRRIVKILLVGICVTVVLMIRYYWNHPERLSALTVVSRIDLAKKYFQAYGVNLFGHQIVSGYSVVIPNFSRGYYYLDNAFAWLIISYGIIAFLIFIIAYVKYFRKLLKKEEWNIILISFAYLIYMIVEHTPLMIVFNSMLIGFGMIIYDNFKIDSEKEAEQRNSK